MKILHLENKHRGISLIELMIAMTLGLFLIGGVIQIFLSSQQSYRMQSGLSRMQENGRFAMDFLTRDIRMGDYWDCLKNGLGDVTNNLDTGGAGYNATLHGFTQGISGTNGAAGANAALDAPDALSFRGISENIPVEAPFGPQASSNIKVPAGNTLNQGDIVLVSDCSHGDIFQISNANPSAGPLVHNTGNATQPGNFNVSNPGCPGGNAHCLSKVYTAGSLVHKITSISYSIQAGANGRPALFKQANELIEGIENMQLLYGSDTTSDSTANYYVPAGTAGLDINKVVSLRISLLIASDDNLTSAPRPYTYNGVTTTPADRRIRRVFSSTIALRNRLP